MLALSASATLLNAYANKYSASSLYNQFFMSGLIVQVHFEQIIWESLYYHSVRKIESTSLK